MMKKISLQPSLLLKVNPAILISKGTIANLKNGHFCITKVVRGLISRCAIDVFIVNHECESLTLRINNIRIKSFHKNKKQLLQYTTVVCYYDFEVVR